MIPVKPLGVAVIGDQDLISMMRLAGVSRYYLVQGQDIAKEVRQAFSDMVSQPDVGVILVMEDYAQHITDLVLRLKENKRITPVIVEIPSKHGTIYGDVKEYYKAYIQKFIGFEIEI